MKELKAIERFKRFYSRFDKRLARLTNGKFKFEYYNDPRTNGEYLRLSCVAWGVQYGQCYLLSELN